jgi:hypothetical protein
MDPRRHVVNSWREGGKGGRTEETSRKTRFSTAFYLNVVARDAACICTCIVERVERVAILMQTGNVLVISGDLADDSL